MNNETRTVTDDEILALRREAAEASDLSQIVLCDLAIDGTITLNDYSGGGWSDDDMSSARRILLAASTSAQARRMCAIAISSAREMAR
jgi:hypothetical protein